MKVGCESDDLPMRVMVDIPTVKYLSALLGDFSDLVKQRRKTSS